MIKNNLSIEKITKRVDRMIKISNMNKKERPVEEPKPHRSYFSSNIKDFYMSVSSKNPLKRNISHATPVPRWKAANDSSSNKTPQRLKSHSKKQKLIERQRTDVNTSQLTDLKTRNRNGGYFRPFTAKIHNRETTQKSSYYHLIV